MASKKAYSKKEIKDLISTEVNKKSYSYAKWSVQNFFVGILGVILIIIIVSIISLLGY